MDDSTAPSLLALSPPAYQLALTRRQFLLSRALQLETELAQRRRGAAVKAFEYAIRAGAACVNMSLESCNLFLDQGLYLNIYELAAKETGKVGSELYAEVARRIPRWYDMRRQIEGLLQFGYDTHYAYLNVGGRGPERYRDCCVVFDLSYWRPYHTCFGGDSIRAIFDRDDKKVVSDGDALDKFAIGEDIYHITLLKYEWYLRDHANVVDLTNLQATIEDEDSIIEFHRHGPIMRSHVQQIVMPRAKFNAHQARVRLAEHTPEPWPREFDSVKPFITLKNLAENFNIPIALI